MITQYAKFEILCERIREFPQIALDKIRSGKRVYSAIIFLPHSVYGREVAKVVHKMFFDTGFAVDQVAADVVSGPEFIVRIRPISPYGLIGFAILAIHTAYIPTADGLTARQIGLLRRLAEYVERKYTEPDSIQVMPY